MWALQLAKKEPLQRTLKTPAAKELLQITRLLVVTRKKGCAQVSFLQTEKSEIQRPRETGRIVIAPSHTNLAPKTVQFVISIMVQNTDKSNTTRTGIGRKTIPQQEIWKEDGQKTSL
jgi:hypothetical protein